MSHCISQIYLSDIGSNLPDYLQHCVNQVKFGYPSHEHIIYDKDTLRVFIKNHFDSSVLRAYDKLRPYAYKADLGRYCLLYEKGGWYFDISSRLINPVILESNVKSLAFRDMQYASGTSFPCSNSILFAKKGDPVFEYAINTIIKHCDIEYYGISTMCPTGPNVLGQAFAIHGADSDRIFGEHLLLTPYYFLRNPAFVLANGTIFALKKPSSDGGLIMFGAKGTNDYNEFYNSRRVYG
jgi:mannosyltransferase OCH1-like enzyme